MTSPQQILLIEDNPADIGLVRQALLEHQVHGELQVISDGESVLQFIDRLDADVTLPAPHLLLLDLHLPKRDGAEILDYLRASKRCCTTPVVILSSSPAMKWQHRAKENAVLYHFHKPSNLGNFLELGAIVKDVLLRSDRAVRTMP